MTQASSTDGRPLSPLGTRKQNAAAIVGTALEWYDFAAYGFLAPIIGKVFFPADDPIASLLAAFGALAVGYAARPIGSIVFGHLGDRMGRKPALMLSVAMMGCATLGVAILPGYAELGVTAAAILILLRAIQGISAAGEYSCSSVLLVERAPAGKRGLIGGWLVSGCNLGFLLGAAVGAAVSNLLGDAQLAAWGWRIPFFLGAVVAVYALFLRRGLDESPVMASMEDVSRIPALEAIRTSWRSMIRIICLILPTGVMYFVVFVYGASYLTEEMHYTTAEALDISTLALILLVVIPPVAGLVSDRVGRRPVIFTFAIASILLTWPLWLALHQHSLVWILFAQLAFALINGIGWGMTVPVMVELLPPRVRCSGAGISYNLCLGIFGGITPWVATYLVSRTSDDFAPAYYVILAAVIALIAAIRLPELARKPLAT